MTGTAPDTHPTLVVGTVVCPTCERERELVAEPCAWVQDTGEITEYGPGHAECCGRLFVHTFEGLRVYRLQDEEGE